MTDIVERLRRVEPWMSFSAPDPTRLEAADEIERLNAVINGMVEKGMNNLTMVAAFQVNEELRAEIERLTALKTPASRQLLNITKGCLDDAEADNARLRAALAEYAQDENWRMNARFDPNSPRFDGTTFARRALEDKP